MPLGTWSSVDITDTSTWVELTKSDGDPRRHTFVHVDGSGAITIDLGIKRTSAQTTPLAISSATALVHTSLTEVSVPFFSLWAKGRSGTGTTTVHYQTVPVD